MERKKNIFFIFKVISSFNFNVFDVAAAAVAVTFPDSYT